MHCVCVCVYLNIVAHLSVSLVCFSVKLVASVLVIDSYVFFLMHVCFDFLSF
jgi:hypothetical protein